MILADFFSLFLFVISFLPEREGFFCACYRKGLFREALHRFIIVRLSPKGTVPRGSREAPGADSRDTHIPDEERIGCARFGQETGGWGLSATREGKPRHTRREEAESSSSAQDELTQSKIEVGGRKRNNLETRFYGQ